MILLDLVLVALLFAVVIALCSPAMSRKAGAALVLALTLFTLSATSAAAFRGDWNFPPPPAPPANDGPCRGGRAC